MRNLSAVSSIVSSINALRQGGSLHVASSGREAELGYLAQFMEHPCFAGFRVSAYRDDRTGRMTGWVRSWDLGICFEYDSSKGWAVAKMGGAVIEFGDSPLYRQIASLCEAHSN